MSKLVSSLREALEKAGLQSGMTISFHHHLRNGDYVLNMVLEEAEKMGVRDLGVEASSVFDVHAPIIDHIRNGVVTRLGTNYMGAKVGKAITQGVLDTPSFSEPMAAVPTPLRPERLKSTSLLLQRPVQTKQATPTVFTENLPAVRWAMRFRMQSALIKPSLLPTV